MPASPEKPIAEAGLSVVVCGRNDNHNGDFEMRAEYALRHNAALLTKAGIDYEFVWVEWNPLPARRFFAESVKDWVKNFRAYLVPPEVHNHYCDNPRIGVMQFLAKNTGIRRARRAWILSMNADTYLTEAVLQPLAAGTLQADTFYLAARVDFAERHLRQKPAAYPIPDLAQREVVGIDEIRLPNAYGSAGDFTLMHRNLFAQARGHYEAIRFSNHHLDTLLGRQIRALGGKFAVLGRVYHADHADSWNNFTLEDITRHHGGSDYNSLKIAVPYANPENWGLADFQEIAISPAAWQLAPPKCVNLRADAPQTIIVPPELRGIDRAARDLVMALREIRQKSLRVVIYGLGNQIRRSLLKGLLHDCAIIGYIDDHGGDTPPLPGLPRFDWAELQNKEYDAILIGSFYWADELFAKASRHVEKTKILPRRA